jgi:endonuclease-3
MTAAKRPSSAPTSTAAQRARALRLADALREHYPDAHCELVFHSPHELLVATILSAQATDVSVNKVTPALFAAFPSPKAFADSNPEAIEPYIRSIGLFRNKAKSIHAAMTTIVENFGGEVPQTMHELLTLRGVARKTANVVLGNAFIAPPESGVGFVVDTHIDRLSKRFGLVPLDANVQQVERRLMALFPPERWCELSHQIIWHGRRACKARGGSCADHPICREFGTHCELRVSASKRAQEGSAQQAVKKPAVTTTRQQSVRTKNRVNPSAAKSSTPATRVTREKRP